ncbi:MAG: MFS transporter [Bryobacterales bacterium]|nr:MFS transporter [Bryobacterales bacterium]
MDRVSLNTPRPMMMKDLGLTNTQLGIAFSAFSLPYAFFQLVGGWIGDRFGVRRTLFVGCLIVGVSTALTGGVGGFASLVALRIALGFGEGAALPTATRAMAIWTPASRWGFAQGITHAFARIGNAVTPLLMAGMLLFITWRTSFVVLGIASLLWLVVWMWFYRDDPREHPSITAAELATLPARSAKARPEIPWLRLGRRILPVTMVDFCYGWTLWLFQSWIPAFFYENYHLNLQSSALFSMGVLSAGVIGDTVGGVMTDRLLRRTGNVRIARRNVLIVGFLGAFVFLLPVMLIHDLTVATLGLSLAFFFSELIVAPIWAIPMDIAPRYAGTASGMMNFGFGAAGLISPAMFGYLVDRTGSWVVPFVASVVLLLIGAVLTLRLRPDIPFEE